MSCPRCGSKDIELLVHSDDTGDYFKWVCYFCGWKRQGNIPMVSEPKEEK